MWTEDLPIEPRHKKYCSFVTTEENFLIMSFSVIEIVTFLLSFSLKLLFTQNYIFIKIVQYTHMAPCETVYITAWTEQHRLYDYTKTEGGKQGLAKKIGLFKGGVVTMSR